MRDANHASRIHDELFFTYSTAYNKNSAEKASQSCNSQAQNPEDGSG